MMTNVSISSSTDVLPGPFLVNTAERGDSIQKLVLFFNSQSSQSLNQGLCFCNKPLDYLVDGPLLFLAPDSLLIGQYFHSYSLNIYHVTVALSFVGQINIRRRTAADLNQAEPVCPKLCPRFKHIYSTVFADDSFYIFLYIALRTN